MDSSPHSNSYLGLDHSIDFSSSQHQQQPGIMSTIRRPVVQRRQQAVGSDDEDEDDGDIEDLIDAIDVDEFDRSQLGISAISSGSSNDSIVGVGGGRGIEVSALQQQRLLERSRLLNSQLIVNNSELIEDSDFSVPSVSTSPATAAAAASQQQQQILREIGELAVWSVSSCKPGCSIHNLRDDNLQTFWQSEGLLPHFINLQFQRLQPIAEVRLFLDYTADESYIPETISVRFGNSFHDLREAQLVRLHEPPRGWFSIRFQRQSQRQDDQDDQTQQTMRYCLRTRLLQLAILSNHQNGRDCRIREIKLFGPSVSSAASAATSASAATTSNRPIFSLPTMSSSQPNAASGGTFAALSQLLSLRQGKRL